MRLTERQEKEAEAKKGARVLRGRRAVEAAMTAHIVPALVAARFDRKTQARVYSVAYDWDHDLGQAIKGGFRST